MEDEETAVEVWKEEEEEAESHFDFVLAVVSRLGFARRLPSPVVLLSVSLPASSQGCHVREMGLPEKQAAVFR